MDMSAAEDTKDSQWRINLRNNVSTVVAMTTVYPFKYLPTHRGAYFLCYYCTETFYQPAELRNHNRERHPNVKEIPRPKGYRPIKMDFAAASCKICSVEIRDYAMLKSHLAEHGKNIDTTRGDSILPYNLESEQHVCQICDEVFESFVRLLRHMAIHSDRHMCNRCETRFNSYPQLMTHIRSKECIKIPPKKDSDKPVNATATETIDGNPDEQRRANLRNNILTIITTTTVYPFKYHKGAYLCYYCDKTYLDPDQLRQHNRDCHSELKVFPRPKSYEPIKVDFVGATCKLCSARIHDYAMLQSHLAEHGKEINTTHGESVLPYDLTRDKQVCQICKKSYETFLSLHRHMNEHCDLCICDKCGKKFKTYRQLTTHRHIHEHENVSCKKCDETFTSHSARHTHECKVHRKYITYKCPACDEKFAYYRHRLLHMAKYHNHKIPEYPCPSCDRVFDLSSKRTTHIKSQHLKERNHECSLCDMKFFTRCALKNHLVKHGGERIYQCDICKKTYARLKTLREHMRIHNDDRRFACTVCELTFIQKCSMKHHMRVHHPAHFKEEFDS